MTIDLGRSIQALEEDEEAGGPARKGALEKKRTNKRATKSSRVRYATALAYLQHNSATTDSVEN
jgi:hypothetical protein